MSLRTVSVKCAYARTTWSECFVSGFCGTGHADEDREEAGKEQEENKKQEEKNGK